MSLSTIGNEELAKAVLYVLAALDAVPGLRKRLPHGRPATDHKAKQVTIKLAGIGAWLADEYQSIAVRQGLDLLSNNGRRGDWYGVACRQESGGRPESQPPLLLFGAALVRER